MDCRRRGGAAIECGGPSDGDHSAKAVSELRSRYDPRDDEIASRRERERERSERQAEHCKAEGEGTFLGVDGVKGTIADMRELGVWNTFQVKTQTIKTAIESACMLLRIDDIVSGMQSKQ